MFGDKDGVAGPKGLGRLHLDLHRDLSGADVDWTPPTDARIEMHREAREALTVHWPGGERRFAAGERLHTENSYKWSATDFSSLLRDAGFSRVQRWSDGREWFALFLAAG